MRNAVVAMLDERTISTVVQANKQQNKQQNNNKTNKKRFQFDPLRARLDL
jgi:hypothetical protein